jgi:hypothetical protein
MCLCVNVSRVMSCWCVGQGVGIEFSYGRSVLDLSKWAVVEESGVLTSGMGREGSVRRAVRA